MNACVCVRIGYLADNAVALVTGPSQTSNAAKGSEEVRRRKRKKKYQRRKKEEEISEKDENKKQNRIESNRIGEGKKKRRKEEKTKRERKEKNKENRRKEKETGVLTCCRRNTSRCSSDRRTSTPRATALVRSPQRSRCRSSCSDGAVAMAMPWPPPSVYGE